MTPLQDKLADAREALLDFESANPRSKEDAREAAESWLETAVAVAAFDVAGAVGGAGLQREHLALALDAYTVTSEQFRSWVLAQASGDGLLSRKDRDKRLASLRKTVQSAETAIVREQLEADKQAAEMKLAALERGEQA